MGNLNDIFAMPEPTAPRVTGYPLDYLVDKPEEVRWRAGWKWNWDKTRCDGIELTCYPVLSVTPAGAWIDEHAYHHGDWVLSGKKRWVSNDGGSAWAKPTRQKALDSIAWRYQRWASRLSNDIDRFLASGEVLTALLPDKAWIARDGKNLVRATAAARRRSDEV